MAAVARECAVSVKAVEDYFSILEDLLIAVRLPVFTKRAKRRLIANPKFYYFDAGVFQAIRPRGPLDAPEQIHGPALETLFLQQARALNDYKDLGYRLHYWRTANGAGPGTAREICESSSRSAPFPTATVETVIFASAYFFREAFEVVREQPAVGEQKLNLIAERREPVDVDELIERGSKLRKLFPRCLRSLFTAGQCIVCCT